MALDRCQNFVSAQYLENKRTELTKFVYTFILTRSKLGLLTVNFHFITELPPLKDVNVVSAQYLENKLTEFDQLWYTHQHFFTISARSAQFLCLFNHPFLK